MRIIGPLLPQTILIALVTSLVSCRYDFRNLLLIGRPIIQKKDLHKLQIPPGPY